MTNREKYLDEILAAMSWGKFSGEIRSCHSRECGDCDFMAGICSCDRERLNWLQAEVDKEPEVDWNKVPVDTPIYVKGHRDENWHPRYFAKYEDGLVYAWQFGTTSWSGDGSKTKWKHVKLAKEDKR